MLTEARLAKKSKNKTPKGETGRKRRFSFATYLGVGLGSAIVVLGASSAFFNRQWEGLYLSALGVVVLAVVVIKERS